MFYSTLISEFLVRNRFVLSFFLSLFLYFLCLITIRRAYFYGLCLFNSSSSQCNYISFSQSRYKNENVAIKIIRRGETPEEIAKTEARFAREVAMLSKVQHKNLAKVVDTVFS